MSAPRLDPAFELEGISVRIDRLLPTRANSENMKESLKFRALIASIREVGIIEPLSVFPQKGGKYLLLDGHARAEALRELGIAEAPCLVSLANEGYSYNKRVNRIAPIQANRMILKALDAGVPEERIARALNLAVETVRMASQLLSLFRVDRIWTESHLLPLFDWNSDATEAKAAWEGFLWAPRLYPPLLVGIKPQFLETARHFEELNEHQNQFAAFLTYAALDPVETYTPHDFQTAIGNLPQAGLQQVARALSQALEGAGDQREGYWKNRVLPFWQNIWPKSRDLTSRNIADSMVRLCLAAGAEFPSALSTVQDWLQPIEHPHYLVGKLEESGLCGRFPPEALRLLDIIIVDPPWVPEALGKCLSTISGADASILQDRRFRRLDAYYRQRRS